MADFAVLAGPMTAARATNGYFSHGYGIKDKGMGAASVTMTDNAFGGANNPAAAAWAGNRLDLGVDLFWPNRSMTRANSGAGFGDASVKSDANLFVIPEIGFNRAVNDKLGLGVTVYGNGGILITQAASSTAARGLPMCFAVPGDSVSI